MKNTDIDRYSREYKEYSEHKELDVLCELEKALNDEWLAYYQYWSAYTSSRGSGKIDIDPELKEHAKEEWDHIKKLGKRINELGGSVVLDPTDLKKNAHEWEPISSIEPIDILKDLKHAELTAIKNYEDLIANMCDKDPVTKLLLIEILAKEQEHYHDLDILSCSLV